MRLSLEDLCNRKLLDEANRDETPFYKIDGLDDLKLRYLRLVGRPFRFRKSRLPTYPTIPYGMPVSVLQEPSFEGMPNVTFLTLMLSRSCDFKIRSIVRNQTKGRQMRLIRESEHCRNVITICGLTRMMFMRMSTL